MYAHIFTTLLFLCYSTFGYSQPEILDNYVAIAINNNISIKQKQLNYKSSQLALKTIKRKYLPKLSFQSRYSRAVGGRVFKIPLGDFLNPVYQNLNLLNSSIKTLDPDYAHLSNLPTIENENFNFLRRTEQVTFFRVASPILNFNLIHTQKLQQYQLEIEARGLLLNEKTLEHEVRKNYYNYLQTNQLEVVLQYALDLVNDNLKTAKGLVKHHQVTKDYIYSVETEVKSVEKEMAKLQSQKEMAKAYFNLLLNRAIDAEILISQEKPAIVPFPVTLKAALASGIKNRLELDQLKVAAELADQKIKLRKSDRLPELNFVADYGFQGTGYEINRQGDYAIGSVVLSWELWNAETGLAIEQAKVDKQLLNYQQKAAEQKIQMEIVSAFYDLETAQKSLALAQAKKTSAEQTYRLVNKKFIQKQATVVELNQARTQLIQMEKEIIISTYDVAIKRLDLNLAIGD